MRALTSSQCFGVNLFAPLALDPALARQVLPKLLPERALATTDTVEDALEFTPLNGPKWLGERRQRDMPSTSAPAVPPRCHGRLGNIPRPCYAVLSLHSRQARAGTAICADPIMRDRAQQAGAFAAAVNGASTRTGKQESAGFCHAARTKRIHNSLCLSRI